eukprot:g1153.t1
MIASELDPEVQNWNGGGIRRGWVWERQGGRKSLHKRRFHELEDLPSEHSDDLEYIPSAEASESEQEQEQGGGQGVMVTTSPCST